jgi:hypothetical protein
LRARLVLALALLLAFVPSAFAAPQATRTYIPEADTWVRPNLATSQYANANLRSGLFGAGVVNRSFLRFSQGAVDDLRSKNVISAQLRLYGTEAGACDRRVDARRLTSGFNSSTVWSNQPTAASTVEGFTTQGAGGPTCADGWISIPVTKATIDGWADGVVPNHGVLVRANNEADSAAWRVFSSLESASTDPQLVVTYNTAPAVPVLSAPAAGATGACDPTLSASFSDVEGGEGRVDFQVLDSAGALVTGGSANSVAGKASWKVPRNADGTCKLAAGQSYSWRARAYDGRDYSGWSAGRGYSVASAPPPPNDVVFDGTKSTSWSDWHGCDASRIADLTADPTGVWSGPVIRFEVRNSDINANPACVDEPTDNPRTQLVGPDHVEGDAIDRTGDTASVVFDGYSVFIPASWPASIPEWIALHSNYGAPYGGSSDVYVGLTDGTLRSPNSNGAYNWQPAWSTAMSGLRGRWVNIVQEVKRSHDEKVGYVRQWYSTDRDALEPTTFTGPGCGSVSSDGRTCYKTTFGPAMDDGKLSPRIGLYHSKAITTPDPMLTYFRAFKQGKTLDSVDPTKAS